VKKDDELRVLEVQGPITQRAFRHITGLQGNVEGNDLRSWPGNSVAGRSLNRNSAQVYYKGSVLPEALRGMLLNKSIRVSETGTDYVSYDGSAVPAIARAGQQLKAATSEPVCAQVDQRSKKQAGNGECDLSVISRSPRRLEITVGRRSTSGLIRKTAAPPLSGRFPAKRADAGVKAAAARDVRTHVRKRRGRSHH
jgi:hypothetical protein